MTGLADLEVLIGLAGNLRQVSDAQYLSILAQTLQQAAHASATAPPMPLSTSSKISVGVAVAQEVMTEMASEIRASSPPEATFASGRACTPA